MRVNIKRLIALVMCIAMTMSIAHALELEGTEPRSIEISLDDTIVITYENRAQRCLNESGEIVYPATYNNSTYLPVRALCYILGLNITWDNNRRVVNIEDDTSVKTPEPNGEVGATGIVGALEDRSIAVTYNGIEQKLVDTNNVRIYPIVYDGTTYLPVRYIGELLDCGIGWDRESRTVSINGGDFILNNLFDTLAGGYSESQYVVKPGEGDTLKIGNGLSAEVADTGLYRTLYLVNSNNKDSIYHFDCAGYDKLDIIAISPINPEKLAAYNPDTGDTIEISSTSSAYLVDHLKKNNPQLLSSLSELYDNKISLEEIQKLYSVCGTTLDIKGWDKVGFYSTPSTDIYDTEIVIAYAHLYN